VCHQPAGPGEVSKKLLNDGEIVAVRNESGKLVESMFYNVDDVNEKIQLTVVTVSCYRRG
jgi:hypothetical protein